MVPQGMSKMNNILKDQSIAASSAPRPKPATFLSSPRAGLDLSPSPNLIADTPPASAKASESSWSMMNKMDASSIIALGSPTNGATLASRVRPVHAANSRALCMLPCGVQSRVYSRRAYCQASLLVHAASLLVHAATLPWQVRRLVLAHPSL